MQDIIIRWSELLSLQVYKYTPFYVCFHTLLIDLTIHQNSQKPLLQVHLHPRSTTKYHLWYWAYAVSVAEKRANRGQIL